MKNRAFLTLVALLGLVFGVLPATAAHAATGGTITGRVTSEANVPIGSARVEMYLIEQSWWQVATTYTDNNGNYTLTIPSDGDYKLRFQPPAASSYLAEWYDNASSDEDATPVTVTGGSMQTVNAQLELGARFTGKVTAPGGAGLGNAYVWVYSSNEYDSVAYAYTDMNGSFTTGALRPGEYRLQFSAPYQSQYLGEWYQNKTSYETADPVQLTTPGTDVTVNAELARGAMVSGRVVGAQTGQPISNVSVDLDSSNGEYGAYGYTDSNGEFVTGAVPSGKYRLRFSPSQDYIGEYYNNKRYYYDADLLSLVSGQNQRIEAALDSASRITGRITDAQGAGVAATVRAYNDEWSRGVNTAADGTYTLRGLPPGTYVLRVTPEEPSALVSEYYNGQRDEESADRIRLGTDATFTADVVLDTGATITGRVVDESDQAVSGVTVRAMGAENEKTVTDANGDYRLTGLEPGSYTVRFTPGNGLARQWYDGADSSEDATPLTVGLGETRTGVDARLRTDRTIGGTVTAAGNPVADVVVEVYRNNESYYRDRTYTDAQGAFRTTDLPEGDYHVKLRPSSPSPWASQWYDKSPTRAGSTPVTVANGSSPTISAELQAGGRIEGTVTGPGNAPLEDVYVTAQRGQDYRSAQTGADGKYVIEGLTTGAYSVSFWGNQYVEEWYDDKADERLADPVNVTLGQTVSSIDARLTRAGSVSGTVRTSDNKTVPYAEVELYQGDRWVGSDEAGVDGKYTIWGVAPGQYTLFTYGGGQSGSQWWNGKSDRAAADVFTVTEGQALTGMDFTLGTGRSVSGTVTRGDGTPLMSGSVELYELDGDYARSGYVSDGAYRVTGVAPGTYHVQFRSYESRWLSEWWQDKPDEASATPLTVPVGQDVTGIDAVLSKGGVIRGTVANGNGQPLRACVRAYDGLTDDWVESDCTDLEGAYEIAGLPAGDYTVRFDPYSSNYAPQWWDGAAKRSAASTIRLASGAETTADAVLLAGGTVTGVVTDESDDPVGGVMVRAYSRDGGYDASAVTDGQGRYTLAGLDAEDYRLQAVPGSNRLDLASEWFDDASGYATADPVSVASGDVATANFALQRGATISGVVTDADDRPVSGIGVDVFDLDGNKALTVWTNSNGEYTSTSLKAGEYKVRFLPGYYGGEGLVEEWWNDKPTEAKANFVFLSPREQKTGVDAQLAKVGTATPPGAPTDVTAVPGNRSVTLRWKAPVDNGGLPVTRYSAIGAPEGECATFDDLECTITGLSNGTTYTFTVKAGNGAGLSVPSASVTVVPFGPPGKPTGVTAVAGQEKATVSWSSPAANGRPITGYTVTAAPGGRTCTTAGTSCEVTGLAGGTAYTFRVVARNEAGDSAPSDASNAVTPSAAIVPPPASAPGGGGTPPPANGGVTPPAAPAAPAAVKPKVKKRKLTLTWAPVAGATSYQVKVGAKGKWKTVTKPVLKTGKLKKGKYVIQVKAVGPGGASPVAKKTVKVR